MRTGYLLWAAALLLLAACHGDADQAPIAQFTPHPRVAPAAKRAATPDELTAGMVEAVTLDRSTVPVAVKFDLPQRPVVGQPFDVVIAIMPQISADPAVLTVAVGDGLQLASGYAPIEIPSVEPPQVYRHNIQLTPTAEGVQLLGLSVSLRHDEITETRAFSVPVIVAAGAATGAGRH